MAKSLFDSWNAHIKRFGMGFLFFALFLCSLKHSSALQTGGTECSRRQIFQAGVLIGGSGWLLPEKATAVAKKGAAELDLEYYVRDLFGGNAREGNVQRSAPPPMPPPRTLREPLLSLLLDDDCTQTCVPCQALVQQLQSSFASPSAAANAVSQQTLALRSKVAPSFANRAQWKSEHVSDQYYFDLTSYALWRTAADLLPDYVARNTFARNVGRGLYKEANSKGLLQKSPQGNYGQLTATIPAMTEILDLFQSSQFCSSYRIGSDDKTVFFDEIDDDDIQSGFAVDCLVSVFEPATLGATLQITGEQSRFSPEFVGITLAAMWESAGIKATYETYFVDQTYRPNPKDYFPNEQLLQFSLTKKK